jgi:hypothetical protein
VFFVGFLFLVFACSERPVDLVEVEPTDDASNGNTLFYWFGEEYMVTQRNTIQLDKEITVTGGKAKIQAATYSTSASHIYIYDADCVRVGTFEVKPSNYGYRETEMIFDDSTKKEVSISFMNLYSWWNGATLKSLHFYSGNGLVTDSVWLPVPKEEEGEEEESQVFDELSSEKMVLNLKESVLPLNASVRIKSHGTPTSKILIYAFTEDHVKIGEYQGDVKEFSTIDLPFQPANANDNQMDTLQKVSYLECYSFGAKAKMRAAFFFYANLDEDEYVDEDEDLDEDVDYSEDRCF